MNSDIEELYSFCGRLGLLQVHDCKGDGGWGWHLEQAMGLNSMGEPVQNYDKKNQLIGGT